MGLVSVKESGSNPRSGRLDSSTRSYTRHIIMQVDSTADNVVSVYGYLAGLGIYWGQYYLVTDESGTLVNYDDGAFITAISPTRRGEHPFLWDVVIEYSPYQLGGANGTHPTNMPARSGGDPQQNPNVQPNPLLRPPVVHWGSIPNERLMSVDTRGNPIVNSAGQPFPGMRVKGERIQRLTITRNEADFDFAAMNEYVETTNLTQFLHAKPGNALMDVSGRSVFEGAIGQYWEVTYTIDITKDYETSASVVYMNPDGDTLDPSVDFAGWATVILDSGRKANIAGDLVDIKVGGRPTTIDVPLDGAGDILSDPADPKVYLVFDTYRQKSWAPLDLE